MSIKIPHFNLEKNYICENFKNGLCQYANFEIDSNFFKLFI